MSEIVKKQIKELPFLSLFLNMEKFLSEKNQKVKKDTSFEEYKVQNILSLNQLNRQIKLNEV